MKRSLSLLMTGLFSIYVRNFLVTMIARQSECLHDKDHPFLALDRSHSCREHVGTMSTTMTVLDEISLLRTERFLMRSKRAQKQYHGATTHRNSRTLLGIFVDMTRDGLRYRRKFRKLFPLHPNVCSFVDYQNSTVDTASCELVYTFVIGGWNDTSVPGQRLHPPFLVSSEMRRVVCDDNPLQVDCMASDITMLDIRENMNGGKSPTWMAYAASVVEQWDIDYVGKQDTDTITKLDDFFQFSRNHLPPSPYNDNILASLFANKFWWDADRYGMRMIRWIHNKHNTSIDEHARLTQLEGPFTQKYGNPLRLYLQGQFYVLSSDLCTAIAREAISKPSYLDTHEDHDVTAMAVIGAPRPITFIAFSKTQKCWQHKMKSSLGKPYHDRWNKEVERISTLVEAEFGTQVLNEMQHRTVVGTYR
jgi:hypothetical protein